VDVPILIALGGLAATIIGATFTLGRSLGKIESSLLSIEDGQDEMRLQVADLRSKHDSTRAKAQEALVRAEMLSEHDE